MVVLVVIPGMRPIIIKRRTVDMVALQLNDGFAMVISLIVRFLEPLNMK